MKKAKNDYHVRPASLDDFQKLEYAYERDIMKHSQPLSSFPLIEWVSSDSFLFPVAELKNKIVGFMVVRIVGSSAKIDKFSILKSYSNKGVAKKLLSYIEPLLIGREISVYLPKRKKNFLKKFHKFGFKDHTEIPELFGKKNDGVMLKKTIIIERPKPRKKATKNQKKIIKQRTEIKKEEHTDKEIGRELDEPEEADADKYYFM